MNKKLTVNLFFEKYQKLCLFYFMVFEKFSTLSMDVKGFGKTDSKKFGIIALRKWNII